MTTEINLGNLVIPVIKPQKGVDYYTEAEKQEIISTVTSNVNSVVLPQEATRQSNENARQSNESTRQSQETIRQENEASRQSAENTRIEAETTRQENETSRISEEQTRSQTFNAQMEAVDTAIAGINTSQESFNQNAISKTTAYNENATSKTSDFNTNASNKTTAFNDNASAKTSAFDEHTAEIQAKLATIEEGAEVNVIETVKVNGTALTPTDKAVDVTVPTKTSDLTNDSGFGTYTKPSGGIPKTDLASDVQTSLGKADTAIQSHQDITGKEDKSNKVTTLSGDSTDTEYPSAKAVYDIKAEKNAEIKRLQTQVTDLKNNSLKDNPTPATSIDLTDSADMEVVSFGIEGHSEQDGTPSPDNVVPIKSSGDNGSITEKIVNGNLASPLLESGTIDATTGQETANANYTRMANYIYFGNATKLYLKRKTATINMKARWYDGNLNYLGSNPSITADTSKQLTPPTNAKYLRIAVDTNNLNYFTEQEVIVSTTDIAYIPYQEQTYTIPVQSSFRSIGDVKDDFAKQNGVWYERHSFRSLNLAIADMNWQENYPGWNGVTQIKTDYPDTNNTLSSLTTYKTNIGSSNNGVGINTLSTGSLVYLSKSVFNLTQAEWKTNYPNLVVNLVYKLQNPELTQCTSEQTAILESLPRTYKNITHIYSEDEVEAYVDVTYYKDLETVLNKIDSLEARVALLEE